MGLVEFKLYCKVLAFICQPYSQDDLVDAFMHVYTASTPAPIFSKVPVLHQWFTEAYCMIEHMSSKKGKASCTRPRQDVPG